MNGARRTQLFKVAVAVTVVTVSSFIVGPFSVGFHQRIDDVLIHGHGNMCRLIPQWRNTHRYSWLPFSESCLS